tara:strand:- start:765 stop:1151 length:387 start_codon:yes stop_codon:yes gene_type:complete
MIGISIFCGLLFILSIVNLVNLSIENKFNDNLTRAYSLISFILVFSILIGCVTYLFKMKKELWIRNLALTMPSVYLLMLGILLIDLSMYNLLPKSELRQIYIPIFVQGLITSISAFFFFIVGLWDVIH